MGSRIAYPLGFNPIWHGQARVHKEIGGIIPILVADLVAGGTVALFKAPANLTITGCGLDVPQLDSGGGLTFNLGTAALPTLLLSASTMGRAANAGVPIAFGARGYKFAADTDIILTVVAAATTPVAGNIACFLGGYLDP